MLLLLFAASWPADDCGETGRGGKNNNDDDDDDSERCVSACNSIVITFGRRARLLCELGRASEANSRRAARGMIFAHVIIVINVARRYFAKLSRCRMRRNATPSSASCRLTRPSSALACRRQPRKFRLVSADKQSRTKRLAALPACPWSCACGFFSKNNHSVRRRRRRRVVFSRLPSADSRRPSERRS